MVTIILDTEVLDVLPVGISIADDQGKIVCINKLTEELLGINKEKVVGLFYQQINCVTALIDCPGTFFDLIGDGLKWGIFYDQLEIKALIKGHQDTVWVSTKIFHRNADVAGIMLYFTK